MNLFKSELDEFSDGNVEDGKSFIIGAKVKNNTEKIDVLETICPNEIVDFNNINFDEYNDATEGFKNWNKLIADSDNEHVSDKRKDNLNIFGDYIKIRDNEAHVYMLSDEYKLQDNILDGLIHLLYHSVENFTINLVLNSNIFSFQINELLCAIMNTKAKINIKCPIWTSIETLVICLHCEEINFPNCMVIEGETNTEVGKTSSELAFAANQYQNMSSLLLDELKDKGILTQEEILSITENNNNVIIRREELEKRFKK